MFATDKCSKMYDDIEQLQPDEWDLKMIAEAEKENDGTTISFEDLTEELKLANSER